MAKSFIEMMDGVLEDYAQARAKQLPRVDMAHYYENLKSELTMNVLNWFLRHVDTIADHKEEVKRMLTTNSEPDGLRVPKNKTGVQL